MPERGICAGLLPAHLVVGHWLSSRLTTWSGFAGGPASVQVLPPLGGQVGVGEVVQAVDAVGGQHLREFLVVDEEVALQGVAVLAAVGQFGRARGPAGALLDRQSAAPCWTADQG